ncbi:unnamed protein product [Symbiodinium natans]|uniref:Uncharacterized protein n=1 Tax=Symbiodinium natans TaxID=878477 RepID=A0A812RA51_9DINO|nr:unnamed protein product [Symbiodinium natans]
MTSCQKACCWTDRDLEVESAQMSNVTHCEDSDCKFSVEASGCHKCHCHTLSQVQDAAGLFQGLFQALSCLVIILKRGLVFLDFMQLESLAYTSCTLRTVSPENLEGSLVNVEGFDQSTRHREIEEPAGPDGHGARSQAWKALVWLT